MSAVVVVPTVSVVHSVWAGVAVFAAGWVWELGCFWGLQPEYYDRFLILVASGWLAYHAWPEITARSARPSAFGLPLVLAGALLYPVGWFLFVQVGPRIILTWWGYVGLLLMTAGVLAATRGWFAVRRLAFPLFFLTLALQIPGRINNPLQTTLQSITTSLSFHGLTTLGISVVREGHVLRLPSGDLGVIEACSGVRSVTALTAIALFLAHLRGFGLLRGVVVLAFAWPVIVLVNTVRVVASGLFQEWFGQSAIVGWKHEVLGFAAVFLGLGLVAGITAILRPKERPAAPSAPPPAAPSLPRRGLVLAGGACLLLGLALTLAASAIPVLTQTTDAGGESIDQISPAILSRTPEGETVRWNSDGDIPISDELAGELTYYRGINRRYRDPLGNEVVVFVFHWTSATTVKGYHHPDICLPNRGFEIAAKGVEPVGTPGGRVVPVTYRELTKGRNSLSVVYWTQEGRRVWTDADETAAFSFTYPFKWVGERLKPRPAGEVDDRLVVWCFAEWWAGNPAGKDRMLWFVAALADEVYRVCPWADPSATAPASNR